MPRLLSSWSFSAVLLCFGVGAQAASFDCAKASTRVEKIICDNPTIGQLDVDMARAYRQALQQDKGVRQEQQAWLKERNQCSTPACVQDAYQSRIQALSAGGGARATAPAAPQRQAAAPAASGVDYHEVGRCYGVLDAYVGKGNQLTPGNRAWIRKNPGYGDTFQEIYAKVQRCRVSDPRNPVLHEECAKRLPRREFLLYDGRLLGISQVMGPMNAGDNMRVGVAVMSCSE